MSYCPSCGVELCSVTEAAHTLGVSGSRVRSLVSPRSRRLVASRVGWGWLILAGEVESFHRQPTGVHLPASSGNGQDPAPSACPKCGERFLRVRRAAEELAMSKSGVYAILYRRPDQLRAFRVGSQWCIPAQAVAAYRRKRRNGGKPGDNGVGEEDVEGGTVTVVEFTRQENCECGAYPFPHRPGGGRCENGAQRQRGR